mmetsp:Transcript_1843/g.7656  ORF Transcript_1843/g.7656 Transcript_1843/m.7656 type:complete len:263 (-) Transcript_1843:1792-2580(-)
MDGGDVRSLAAALLVRVLGVQARRRILEEKVQSGRVVRAHAVELVRVPGDHLRQPAGHRPGEHDHPRRDGHRRRNRGLEGVQVPRSRRRVPPGFRIGRAPEGADQDANRHRRVRSTRDACAEPLPVPHRAGVRRLLVGVPPAEVVAVLDSAHARQRRVHVRVHRHDPPAVHQLPAEIRRAHALARVHVQDVQHLHRRRVRVRRDHASHTPHRVPQRRPGVLRVPVPKKDLPGGQEARQRVWPRLRGQRRRRERGGGEEGRNE